MNPFIGQIILAGFNFEPVGWFFCDGRSLPISQYDALFNLIGTTYGGDGQTTFNLPDLRGRAMYGNGAGQEGITYLIGETGGITEVTLGLNQIPNHSHGLLVQSGIGSETDPSGRFLASAPLALGNIFTEAAPNAAMPGGSIDSVGGGQSHSNEAPYLTLNYLIAYEGIFPSRS
jgi:microcystin-dependent protein